MEEAEGYYSSGSQKPGKILVTGASGFIGGHVARYLVDQGLEISCLVRDGSNTGFIKDLPVKLIAGDITDLNGLLTAFRGQDAIIHTAAKVGDWGSYDAFYEANVAGTLNVLKAASENSVGRVIITGSCSSYGEENYPGLKSEESPFHSHYQYFLAGLFPSGMNHYRDTKALMTREAIDFADKRGLDLIILEPVWVYGENEFNTGFYEYVKTVKSGIGFMPGSRKNTFHVIYAGDLAMAFHLALNCGLKGVHRLIAGNPSPEKMVSIHRLFCKEAGLKAPALLPKWFVYPIGFILEFIHTIFRSKNPPILTRGRVNMFYDSIGYDTAKALKMIHFGSRLSLEDGIKRTVKWYRDNNYL